VTGENLGFKSKRHNNYILCIMFLFPQFYLFSKSAIPGCSQLNTNLLNFRDLHLNTNMIDRNTGLTVRGMSAETIKNSLHLTILPLRGQIYGIVL
jgi:hypothetical protein